MPSDVSTIQVSSGSLEGLAFHFENNADRFEAIDKAFDYRGDVTLELVADRKVEGYMSNRVSDASPPYVTVYVKGQDQPETIPYADIKGISFTGKDPATGKSWHDWVNKKTSERQAEAERIREEVERLGHL